MPRRPRQPYEVPHFVAQPEPSRGLLGRRSPPYEWERYLLWVIVLTSCGIELGKEILRSTLAIILPLLS